jgi:hypothetical protein
MALCRVALWTVQMIAAFAHCHQFVLLCGPAETNRNFQGLRSHYGSFWAYVTRGHG